MNQSNKPLDPLKVKTGDTVTLTRKMSTAVGPVTRIDRSDSKGIGFHIDGYPYPLWTQVHPRWTLTDHQPAPEPEPVWEPGDMAAVTARGWINGWSVRTQTNDGWASHCDSDDVRSDAEVESVRPLILIDPAAVDVEALTAAAWDAQDQAILEVGLPEAEAVTRAVLARLGIEAS